MDRDGNRDMEKEMNTDRDRFKYKDKTLTGKETGPRTGTWTRKMIWTETGTSAGTIK